jgi:hypothetical protein
MHTLKKWRDDTMPLTSGTSSISIVNLLLMLQKDAETDPVIELPCGDLPELLIMQFAQDFLLCFLWPHGQLLRLIKSMLGKVKDKLLDKCKNTEDTLTPLIVSAIQSLGITFIPGHMTV